MTQKFRKCSCRDRIGCWIFRVAASVSKDRIADLRSIRSESPLPVPIRLSPCTGFDQLVGNVSCLNRTVQLTKVSPCLSRSLQWYRYRGERLGGDKRMTTAPRTPCRAMRQTTEDLAAVHFGHHLQTSWISTQTDTRHNTPASQRPWPGPTATRSTSAPVQGPKQGRLRVRSRPRAAAGFPERL